MYPPAAPLSMDTPLKSPLPRPSAAVAREWLLLPGLAATETLCALQAVDAGSRDEFLRSMPAAKRDQLLGSTALEVKSHPTGPEYDFDWSTFTPGVTDYSAVHAHGLAITAENWNEGQDDNKQSPLSVDRSDLCEPNDFSSIETAPSIVCIIVLERVHDLKR